MSDKTYQVVIDTPRGSRAKYKFDVEKGLFKISKLLQLGAEFPFNFGFLPGTKGEDGDPLDMLVLMDTPVFPGCLVDARVIGVLEAEQTESAKTIRNDRWIGVSVLDPAYQKLENCQELGQPLLQQIAYFFVSYNVAQGRQFRPLGFKSADEATEALHRQLKTKAA